MEKMKSSNGNQRISQQQQQHLLMNNAGTPSYGRGGSIVDNAPMSIIITEPKKSVLMEQKLSVIGMELLKKSLQMVEHYLFSPMVILN